MKNILHSNETEPRKPQKHVPIMIRAHNLHYPLFSTKQWVLGARKSNGCMSGWEKHDGKRENMVNVSSQWNVVHLNER